MVVRKVVRVILRYRNWVMNDDEDEGELLEKEKEVVGSKVAKAISVSRHEWLVGHSSDLPQF